MGLSGPFIVFFPSSSSSSATWLQAVDPETKSFQTKCVGLGWVGWVGCCWFVVGGWLLVVGLGWVGCFCMVGFVALVLRCLHRRSVRNLCEVDVSVIGRAW